MGGAEHRGCRSGQQVALDDSQNVHLVFHETDSDPGGDRSGGKVTRGDAQRADDPALERSRLGVPSLAGKMDPRNAVVGIVQAKARLPGQGSVVEFLLQAPAERHPFTSVAAVGRFGLAQHHRLELGDRIGPARGRPGFHRAAAPRVERLGGRPGPPRGTLGLRGGRAGFGIAQEIPFARREFPIPSAAKAATATPSGTGERRAAGSRSHRSVANIT